MKALVNETKRQQQIKWQPGAVIRDKKTGELFIGVIYNVPDTLNPKIIETRRRWASTETGTLYHPIAHRFTLDNFEVLEPGQEIKVKI